MSKRGAQESTNFSLSIILVTGIDLEPSSLKEENSNISMATTTKYIIESSENFDVFLIAAGKRRVKYNYLFSAF